MARGGGAGHFLARRRGASHQVLSRRLARHQHEQVQGRLEDVLPAGARPVAPAGEPRQGQDRCAGEQRRRGHASGCGPTAHFRWGGRQEHSRTCAATRAWSTCRWGRSGSSMAVLSVDVPANDIRCSSSGRERGVVHAHAAVRDRVGLVHGDRGGRRRAAGPLGRASAGVADAGRRPAHRPGQPGPAAGTARPAAGTVATGRFPSTRHWTGSTRPTVSWRPSTPTSRTSCARRWPTSSGRPRSRWRASATAGTARGAADQPGRAGTPARHRRRHAVPGPGGAGRAGAPALLKSSLAREVDKTVEFFDVLLEDAEMQVEVVGDAVAPIETSLFRRALSNLLQNAIQRLAGRRKHRQRVEQRMPTGPR